jgi:hypothetical protein
MIEHFCEDFEVMALFSRGVGLSEKPKDLARYGIEASTLDVLLRTRLSQLLYPKKEKGFQTKMNSEQYYTAIDRIFYALPQKQFYYFWDKIGSVDFESNPEKAKELKTLLDTYLIFDGLK